MKLYSIAIDGPAGSGKSTVAKMVAKDLNFQYVNSGLFYRAIAIFLTQKNVNYENESTFNPNILNSIKLSWSDGDVLLDGEDISSQASKQRFANIASIIAQYASIRNFVDKNIIELSKNLNVVVDGRDIGSKVLPDATVKIFLEADVTTRALRRLKDINSKSSATDINSMVNEIIERDNRDYTRAVSPLTKCPDAFVIDNTDLTIEETCEKIKRCFMEKVTDASWKD